MPKQVVYFPSRKSSIIRLKLEICHFLFELKTITKLDFNDLLFYWFCYINTSPLLDTTFQLRIIGLLEFLAPYQFLLIPNYRSKSPFYYDKVNFLLFPSPHDSMSQENPCCFPLLKKIKMSLYGKYYFAGKETMTVPSW